MKIAQTRTPVLPASTVVGVQALPLLVPAKTLVPSATAVETPAPETPAVAAESATVVVPLPAKAQPSPMPIAVHREVPQPRRLVARPLVAPPAPAFDVAQLAPVPATLSPAVAPPPASAEPEHETPASPPASVAPAPQPHQVTLNAGLLLPVRLVDGLSSERNAPGDAFLATLDKELVVDGFVIAERGARVEGHVVTADRGGSTRSGALALELTRLHTSDGQAVTIQTDNFFRHAASSGQTAAKIGGGAVIGAAIGAIAAGGKGSAIGAGAGGAAGAGDVLLTRGKPAELPAETAVVFRLKAPVPLTERLQGP
jgi:hypothetical protein